MATSPVQLQKAWVPIATFTGPNNRPVPVLVTEEWRRSLEDLVKLANDLQARLTAAGL